MRAVCVFLEGGGKALLFCATDSLWSYQWKSEVACFRDQWPQCTGCARDQDMACGILEALRCTNMWFDATLWPQVVVIYKVVASWKVSQIRNNCTGWDLYDRTTCTASATLAANKRVLTQNSSPFNIIRVAKRHHLHFSRAQQAVDKTWVSTALHCTNHEWHCLWTQYKGSSKWGVLLRTRCNCTQPCAN